MHQRFFIILGAILVGSLLSAVLPGRHVSARLRSVGELVNGAETAELTSPGPAAAQTSNHSSEAAELAELKGSPISFAQKMSRSLRFTGEKGVTWRDATLEQWLKTDLAAAARWAAQLPPGPGVTDVQRQVALTLANTDLPGTVSWVAALPDSPAKSAMAIELAYELSRTEPLTALQLATPLAASRERDKLLQHATGQWALTDADAAATWAGQVPDAKLRAQLLSTISISLANRDGAAAAAMVASYLPPGPEQSRAAVSVVQRWAQKDPAAAAQWVVQFPDSPARNTAVESLVTAWTQQDANAATRWLTSLAPGGMRDAGMAAFTAASQLETRTGEF